MLHSTCQAGRVTSGSYKSVGEVDGVNRQLPTWNRVKLLDSLHFLLWRIVQWWHGDCDLKKGVLDRAK